MAKFSASFTFIDRKGIELSVLTSCPKPSAKTKKQQFLGTAQMKGTGPGFFYHSILFALIMHQDLQTICHSVNQHNPEYSSTRDSSLESFDVAKSVDRTQYSVHYLKYKS